MIVGLKILFISEDNLEYTWGRREGGCIVDRAMMDGLSPEM